MRTHGPAGTIPGEAGLLPIVGLDRATFESGLLAGDSGMVDGGWPDVRDPLSDACDEFRACICAASSARRS